MKTMFSETPPSLRAVAFLQPRYLPSSLQPETLSPTHLQSLPSGYRLERYKSQWSEKGRQRQEIESAPGSGEEEMMSQG